MDRAVIGVDLGGTNLRSALLTEGGDILDRHKQATGVVEGHEKVIRRLIENIRIHLRNAERRGLKVMAVGVGAPGVIHADSGVVVKSPNFPDWNNLPLKQELEGVLGIPVFIENDANAAALGEQWRGAGKNVQSMIFLTLGTGVGGGIILQGRIWHGADGMAGEIGHMTIVPDGRQCGCGNQGCLEMYASSRGIIMNYQEACASDRTNAGARDAATSEMIYQAAGSGEKHALHAVDEMGRFLGIGIANLINIFNPEMVVVGGGVKDAWSLFIDAVRREVGRRAFAYPAERTKIVPSVLGDDAGMVGAAAVAFSRVGVLS
ncbi:MAG: ROK family protein [Nitrospirota bacterium]|nr:ROK family protein [Nitrospirota bacterium]